MVAVPATELCLHRNQDLVLDWHPVYDVKYDEEGEVISSNVLSLVERNWRCLDCKEQISEIKELW